MYCQECGSKLPENAKFCMNCGTKVWVEEPAVEVKEEMSVAEEPVAEEPVADNKTDYAVEQAESIAVTPKKTVKKKRKGKKILFSSIIAGVFLFLAFCFFVGKMEQRKLYTLVNPELFFGECTNYVIMKDTPGESGVALFFESDTPMWKEVIWYTNAIDQVDSDLCEYFTNDDPREAATQGTKYSGSWHYMGHAFWPGYSLMDSNRVVTLDHYEENGKYVVHMYIEGYQNCEFLDVNPYTGENADFKGNSASGNTEHQEQPTATPTPTQNASKGPIVEPTTPPASIIKPKATATPKPTSKLQATATPTPTSKPKATSTPKPTKTPTPVPTKAAAKDLVAPEMDVTTAVQPPKNAFQDFASWGMGAVVSADAEQSDSSVQYLDYQASQATVDAYIEMLLQNGFTLVDEYFFQYQSDPFASWALNCDYVPDAGKVEMQYESSTTCHLCISTYEGDYTFNYSSDLTQYDLGLRKDGSVEKVTVKGPSAGEGLYRSADGVYTTTDGRLSASMNKATIIRDGKKDVCSARSEIKNGREWLWVEDYYRNEAICFGVLKDYTMAGDLYQYQDLKREKYYNDDKDVYFYKWGDQPIFEMTVDNKFTGPLVTSKNEFEEVTVRVMHYEEGEEAVYYIYAKTKGTPSEIEVLCAVGLNVEEADTDAENAIVLSVGETHTLTYYANVFGAKAEVYSWSISGGDGIYADGTGSYCKVTAMKKGTGKVTVTCRYTVEVADILTGYPTTEQRSKSKTWYFRVE
ncbi:MAG: zinc-ribbon domain-containing protein [Lachnospiraceae bacterium]|nr:zinc-ribbon domain-containing protein [Lachnospiraceae bacterium]